MTRFIEGRSLQFFLKPGRLGMRVVGRSGGMLFSVLKRITGIDLLQDLSEFFQSFSNMAQGFSERAQRVKDVLGQRGTTFLLVTAPEREAIDEGVFFWRRLKEARLPFGGVVVNKVHSDFVHEIAVPRQDRGTGVPKDELSLDDLRHVLGDGDELAARVVENFERYQALAERDRENMARLTARLDEDCVVCVPYFDDDVHDVRGLAQVNAYLFGSAGERQEILEQSGV
jgi:anion-transporting  ArsA/GET3 family ATPase